MTSLAEYISEQLAENNEVDVPPEQIQGYIDSHINSVLEEESPAPKKKAAAKTSTKAKGSKKTDEKHTCERTINGKEESRICGKNASNELDGMWFCGTEKSGCYKSALSKSPAKASAKATGKAGGVKAPIAKGASKGKPAVVVQKVQKRERLNLQEIPEGSGIWVDLKNYRMVYCQDPKEVYGILDDDDETILPLTEETITFAEGHGIPIRAAAPKTKTSSKKVPPKSKVTETKASAKGKNVATKVSAKAQAKAKVSTKTVVKSAPKAKTAVKSKTPAPKAKASPKKSKTAPVEASEDEILEDLQQEVEDVEVGDATDEEAPEIDLGDEEEEVPEEVEASAENDPEDLEDPDLEEADEGEAADDGDDVEEDGDDE